MASTGDARHRQFRAHGRQADKAGKVRASGQGKGTRRVGTDKEGRLGKAGVCKEAARRMRGRHGGKPSGADAGRGDMGESQAACYMVGCYFIWSPSISPNGPIVQNLAANRKAEHA